MLCRSVNSDTAMRSTPTAVTTRQIYSALDCSKIVSSIAVFNTISLFQLLMLQHHVPLFFSSIQHIKSQNNSIHQISRHNTHNISLYRPVQSSFPTKTIIIIITNHVSILDPSQTPRSPPTTPPPTHTRGVPPSTTSHPNYHHG